MTDWAPSILLGLGGKSNRWDTYCDKSTRERKYFLDGRTLKFGGGRKSEFLVKREWEDTSD